MLKYKFFIANSFLNFFRIKWSFFGIILFLLVMFIIEGYFWYEFYDHNVNKMYTKNSVITYIMIALTMHQIVSCVGRPDQLSEDIELGSINYFILKPLNYLSVLLSIQVGLVIARFFVLFPIILFVLYYNNIQDIFNKLCLLFVFSILCGILNCIINIFLSCFTFFYNDSYGFVILKETLFWVLSGALIPLNLLPVFIQNINKFLPFSYVIFYPIDSILNDRDNIIFNLFVIVFWIIFIFFISNYIWKLGIKKYLAYGG